MAQMQIFLSHSSKDKAFADPLVAALRGAGADVWYDEHNLGAGVLRREINQQLAMRPIVVVVLSKAALTSQWVQDECEWAYNLYRRKPDRLILPVVAAPYDLDDFDQMLFMESLKRVEAPGNKPFPLAEAVERTLRLLELTPAGQRPAPVTPPQPSESASDLLAKGKALTAQGKYAEALPFFERATKLDPRSFDAWANLARAYSWVGRGPDGLAAGEKATQLDPTYALGWYGMGNALYGLGRYQEALAAYDRALVLDPNLKDAWNGKGNALNDLTRYQEALAAYDRALALDPHFKQAWSNKGIALWGLNRYADAVAAYDKAIALDPKYAKPWIGKAQSLRALGRAKEAAEAERIAKALGG